MNGKNYLLLGVKRYEETLDSELCLFFGIIASFLFYFPLKNFERI